MTITQAEWQELKDLAAAATVPGQSLGFISKNQWGKIKLALNKAVAEESWQDIIRIREIFTALFARDTAYGLAELQRLDNAAIDAARHLDDRRELAHLLGAKGHNLHRQGYHQQAIEVFLESSHHYTIIGDDFEALKNYYMTSLCYRALNHRAQSKKVLAEVLERIGQSHPWRRNPLQVMAWLAQDEGNLKQAELYLKDALRVKEHEEGSEGFDIHAAGTLADLAEVVGLQGRTDEARVLFGQSLEILTRYEGQYNRLESRSNLKLAELEIREHHYIEALRLLDQADDKVRQYGHYYDLMWRIELARVLMYLHQFQLGTAFKKWRAVLRFRRELGLSTWLLIRQLIKRLTVGIGLPR